MNRDIAHQAIETTGPYGVNDPIEHRSQWGSGLLARTASWTTLTLATATAGTFTGLVIGEWWAATAGLMGFLVCSLLGAIAYSFGIRPSVLLTSEAVIIHNPFRTIRVSWNEVQGAKATYSGVRIQRAEGRAIVAWAVQKSNLSFAIGRRSRADGLAEAVRRLSRNHGAGMPHEDSLSDGSKSRVLVRMLLIGDCLGLALILTMLIVRG
jgi:hypothetical protein